MAAAEQGYQQILWLNGEDIGEVRFPSFLPRYECITDSST
jgi:hypothetical protein